MPSKKVIFIQELRRTGKVNVASRAADWTRQNAYYHRAEDDLFREMWNRAIREYDDERESRLRNALNRLAETH